MRLLTARSILLTRFKKHLEVLRMVLPQTRIGWYQPMKELILYSLLGLSHIHRQ